MATTQTPFYDVNQGWYNPSQGTNQTTTTPTTIVQGALPTSQPTQQTQTTQQSTSTSPTDTGGVDFGNVDLLSALKPLASPTVSTIGSLTGLTNTGVDAGSLAGAGAGVLSNLLGQATNSPAFPVMGQMAAPAIASALGGGANPLINSINPVGMMIGMGDNGGNVGGSIGGAAPAAIAGGLEALGYAPAVADALGLGTTAAIEGAGGALGGAGAAIGTGLGALGGAAGALAFPAMSLGNIVYGLIDELGGGHHSVAEGEMGLAIGKVYSNSNKLLGQLHDAGLTDQQIADWATKNGYNYMLGYAPKAGQVGAQYDPYTGVPIGEDMKITMVVAPSDRAYLDNVAYNMGPSKSQQTWAGYEGSPAWNTPVVYEGGTWGGVNDPFQTGAGILSYYSPYDAENLSALLVGDISKVTNPDILSAIQDRMKTYADLGYNTKSAQELAMSDVQGSSTNLSTMLDAYGERNLSAKNLVPSAQSLSDSLRGSNSEAWMPGTSEAYAPQNIDVLDVLYGGGKAALYDPGYPGYGWG